MGQLSLYVCVDVSYNKVWCMNGSVITVCVCGWSAGMGISWLARVVAGKNYAHNWGLDVQKCLITENYKNSKTTMLQILVNV